MLLDLAANPCPAGAQPCMVTTADGLCLRAASWQPQKHQRGTILMLQGRAEFIEKYFETITRFLDLGFAVICFDWRGQGGSDRLLNDPMKGHIERFEDYQKDLHAIRSHYAGLLQKPVLAFAHSMGGMVLLRAATNARSGKSRSINRADAGYSAVTATSMAQKSHHHLLLVRTQKPLPAFAPLAIPPRHEIRAQPPDPQSFAFRTQSNGFKNAA